MECTMPGCTGMARTKVCEGHAKEVHSNVTEFPITYVRLRRALIPSQSRSEHVSGTRAPQAAMSISVWSVMEDMVETVERWAVLAREHRGTEPLVTLGRHGPRLHRSVAALQRHGELLLDLSVAEEYVTDMRRIKSRAEVALKADNLLHRLDVPCPACEIKALVRKDGDEWVLCAACGARWDEQSYQRLVKVLAYQLQIMEHRA